MTGGWPQNFVNRRGSEARFKIGPAEPWARGCHTVAGPGDRVPSATTSSAVAHLCMVAKVTLHQGEVEVRLRSAPSSRGVPAAVGTAISARPPPVPPGRTRDRRFCTQAGQQPRFPHRSDLAPPPRVPDSGDGPGREVCPPPSGHTAGGRERRGRSGQRKPGAQDSALQGFLGHGRGNLRLLCLGATYRECSLYETPPGCATMDCLSLPNSHVLAPTSA